MNTRSSHCTSTRSRRESSHPAMRGTAEKAIDSLRLSTLSILLLSCFALALLPLMAHAQGLADFTELVEENATAIVNVSVVTQSQAPAAGPGGRNMEDLLRFFYGERFQQESPAPRRRSGTGSGFIIDSDGYVVTNHHVVASVDEITVTLNDRREYKAELLGSDISSDLALLKI